MSKTCSSEEGQPVFSKRVGNRLTPRFTPAQRNALLQLRLTGEQIRWLNHHLGSVSDWIRQRPSSNDVGDELRGLARELDTAAKRLRRWRDASTRKHGQFASAAAEALGWFNIAAAGHVRSTEHHGIDLRDDYAPDEVVMMAAQLARRAVEIAPVRKRAGVESASPDAVRLIVEALRRPHDEWSRKRAAELPVGRKNDFAKIAEIVWEAVLGRDSKASPERSIKAYVSKLRRSEEGAK